jgi:hypothetical protein
MRGGGLFILFFLGWIIFALWGFFRANETSIDAKQTAAYIVGYPFAFVLALEEKPLPFFVATLLVMAGLPWLMAGLHLSKILKDPSASKPGTFVGLPANLWWWGVGLSLAIPVVAGRGFS